MGQSRARGIAGERTHRAARAERTPFGRAEEPPQKHEGKACGPTSTSVERARPGGVRLMCVGC
jgi:hypothetical protein